MDRGITTPRGELADTQIIDGNKFVIIIVNRYHTRRLYDDKGIYKRISAMTMTPDIELTSQMAEANPFGSWEKEKKYGYSGDQLIEAYETGIEKGINEQQKILRKVFKANIDKTTKAAVNLTQYLKDELNIAYKGMHMKVIDIANISIIIGIAEDDYFTKEFDAAYIKSCQLEKQAAKDDLKIVFQFIYTGKNHLNHSTLASDGYYLHYTKEKAREA